MSGIGFHDVPEYRLAANFDHWLWPKVRLFEKPSPQTARENDCFHTYLLIIMISWTARYSNGVSSQQQKQNAKSRMNAGNICDPTNNLLCSLQSIYY